MVFDGYWDYQNLDITVDPTQPEFLTGLDQWLQLGLIQDEQVRELCQTYLSCPLTQSIAVETSDQSQVEDKISVSLTPQRIFSTVTTPVKRVGYLAQNMVQAFREELSIRWLLFLGVFLVVTSSGLLAASQWQQLSSLGVYGMLWLYTLTFWGVGKWVSQKSNLSLTAKTLQVLVCLLVPINFWAMDSLLFDANWWELILLAIASISLITIFVQFRREFQSWLTIINILLLSYLHWGWEYSSSFPLIAIYGGTVTTVVILHFLRMSQTTTQYSLDLDKGFIIYGLFLLLLRGILYPEIYPQQLGLAIGISGWLLQQKQVAFRNLLTSVLEISGIVLLFLGWLVGVKEIFPWQSTIVAGLGINVFNQRLHRDWRRRDLLAIFLIGIEWFFLILRLLPVELLQSIIQESVPVSNIQDKIYFFYRFILFPYVIFFAIFTSWINYKSQPKLSQFKNYLIFLITVVLGILDVKDPLWRWIDLGLSTAMFAYLSHYQNFQKNFLTYLINICGILTICCFFYWYFPNLSWISWAKILLILMVVSLIISLAKLPGLKIYHQSSRYLGLILGGISYTFLWTAVETFLSTNNSQTVVFWWLLTPLTLTGIGIIYQTERKKRRRALFLSNYSLILFQALTFWQPNLRLISLIISAFLILINSYFFRDPFAAKTQIGFTISIIIFAILENSQGLWVDLLTFRFIFLNYIFNIVFLGLISQGLKRLHHNSFAVIYAKAMNQWVVFLSVILLSKITFINSVILFKNNHFFSINWQHIISIFIALIATAYSYKKTSNFWVMCATIWALELLIISSALWIGTTKFIIALINLSFGLIILKFIHPSQPVSLQILPLFFAVMAVIWRIGIFTPYTGLITLAVGIIIARVDYCFHQEKIGTYIGLGLITIGIQEGVIYHLLQGVGGTLQNQLLILGLITAIFALLYRLFDWVLGLLGYRHFLDLSLAQIQQVAHIHWAIATLLKTIGVAWVAITLLTTKTNPYLNPINVSLSLVLSSYAFVQGRDPDMINTNANSRAEFLKKVWIYLGFLDIASTLIFSRLIWRKLASFDGYYAGIVVIIALFVYYIPWENLGWKAESWQRVSLCLPSLLALVTTQQIAYTSLLLVAVFYLQIGVNQNNLRWSYISLGFINWAIIRFCYDHQLINPLNIALIIGLSILYVAQVEPIFRDKSRDKLRHYLRLLGIGIINFTTVIFYHNLGWLSLGISFFTISLGLGFKIRAFLYSGTIAFIVIILSQLIMISLDNSFGKWLIGLGLGIILIAIAAIFEHKKQKIMIVWQNWKEAFKQWL
ncbi:MAG TPA: hypothetical protein DCF68_17420 [Cyanothece sp. UBA12306]|nr:hypothetical protein [Cyanothece sp. UBA12306]